MSQISVNNSGGGGRKRKRLHSNRENNYVETEMWEQFEVNDDESHENQNSENSNVVENKSEEGAKASGAMRVRSPLAPVRTNKAAGSGVNNNHFDNTLLATSEDFFTYRRDRPIFIPTVDHFACLSDEMILHIFKWLPKKTLTRCSFVCRRFNKIVHTDILWTRLDLGDKNLTRGSLGNIISRGVVILRLASSEIHEPIFDEEVPDINWDTYQSKLQYLDLSMCTISTSSLQLFLSKCRKLKKLSLEHVTVTDDICEEIAANVDIDSLNMTMCEGIKELGLQVMAIKLQNLRSLNISWTSLSSIALEIFVSNVTPGLLRLNIAGCRNTMTDELLAELVQRCPGLVELDVSDCPKLTTDGLKILAQLKDVEYLSISRCYNVDVSTFLSHHLKLSPSLLYIDVFGLIREESLEALSTTFANIGFNKFVHSSVARPTVGTRRTSIWGLRTRD